MPPAPTVAPPPPQPGQAPTPAPTPAPAPAAPAPATPVVVLRPSRGWRALRVNELWAYRELLYFLVWRDLKVRYQQTTLGVLWAVLQPLLTAGLFALIFGRLARVPADGVPYLAFSLAALVPWTFFANGVTQAAGSLVGGQHLITKVYFPRPILPLGAVVAGLVDLALALAVLLAVTAAHGIALPWQALWIPAFAVMALAAALGAGLWLSALNVAYRDVRHALPFVMQLWFFATPVAYSSAIVGARWRPLYALNPMVGVVDGFRWALFGRGPVPTAVIAVSAAATAALLAGGAYYFRRVERGFADVV